MAEIDVSALSKALDRAKLSLEEVTIGLDPSTSAKRLPEIKARLRAIDDTNTACNTGCTVVP
jgi:hypothetical protein